MNWTTLFELLLQTGLVSAVAGFLWKRHGGKSERAQRIAETALLVYHRVEVLAEQFGWLRDAKWKQFLDRLVKELEDAGLGQLSEAELRRVRDIVDTAATADKLVRMNGTRRKPEPWEGTASNLERDAQRVKLPQKKPQKKAKRKRFPWPFP